MKAVRGAPGNRDLGGHPPIRVTKSGSMIAFRGRCCRI